MWATFLGGSLVVALVVIIANANQVLTWALADGQYDPSALGRTGTWTIVLAVFWYLNRERPRTGPKPSRTPVYILAGSAIGLGVASFRLWELGRLVLQGLLDPLWDAVIIRPQSHAVLTITLTAFGLGLWLWFWWFTGRKSDRTERWYAYVLLIGVLSGVVTVVTAAGTLVHSVLQWFFGQPDASTAGLHFESLPGSLSAFAVGGTIWLHHRSLIGQRERAEPDRIYCYLGAAAGLALAAASATMLIVTMIEAAVEVDLARSSVANTRVTAATFAIVGVPLLARFWWRAQHLVVRRGFGFTG